MVIYWVLFGYFALGAIFDNERVAGGRLRMPLLFAVGGILIAGLIGFRYQVGTDWFAYVRIFSQARYTDLSDVMAIGDAGYQVLNWTVQRLGGKLWLVNSICGIIFTIGLFRLARVQPNPWLAVLVAVPYLVIVVAMGYSRQGVAIGLLMAGLASLTKHGSLLRFAGYVAAATLFHKTALVALPLATLASSRNRFINLILAAVLTYFLYSSFLASSMDNFVRHYIEAEYSAQGAAIRVAMSLLPATLFLIQPRAFGFRDIELNLWRNFSLAAIGFLVLLLVLPSSAAVDRLALYIAPLQIVILSRVPGMVVSQRLGTTLVVLYSAMVQYVWLNYAAHAASWVPYQVFPL